MGIWAPGPFENDAAADWAGELDDADPADRQDLLRATLSEAVNEVDYLEASEAALAIAAAAVVAATQPGGPVFDSEFAPQFLRGEITVLLNDLIPLALRAIDRVITDKSEWRELWEQAGELDAALAALTPIREALGG